MPLPAELSGEQETRTVTIDRALLYLVNGALTALVQTWCYQPTGALSEDDARAALEAMLEAYFGEP